MELNSFPESTHVYPQEREVCRLLKRPEGSFPVQRILWMLRWHKVIWQLTTYPIDSIVIKGHTVFEIPPKRHAMFGHLSVWIVLDFFKATLASMASLPLVYVGRTSYIPWAMSWCKEVRGVMKIFGIAVAGNSASSSMDSNFWPSVSWFPLARHTEHTTSPQCQSIFLSIEEFLWERQRSPLSLSTELLSSV